MSDRFAWMLSGAALLLIAKYGIFGLDKWNHTLHPGLIIAPNQRAFRKPLLGTLEQRHRDSNNQPAADLPN